MHLSSPRDNFLSQDNSIRITTPQDFGSEEFFWLFVKSWGKFIFRESDVMVNCKETSQIFQTTSGETVVYLITLSEFSQNVWQRKRIFPEWRIR